MLAQPLLFCDFYLLGLMRLSVFYNQHTPTQGIEVCCSHKVVAVGFNTLCYDAERRGIKPSARIKYVKFQKNFVQKEYYRFKPTAVPSILSLVWMAFELNS